MALVDSKTGKVHCQYSPSQLKEAANFMRGMALVAITLAGTGHPGGSLSIMDIVACLYLKIANHDPKNPDWDKRDRIIFSAGHKAPALYVALGMSGYFPLEEVVTLRKFDSPFQGHPHWLKLKGVEVSTGSLGQGLGVGVGMALSAKLKKQKHKVYVVTGDGEWDEGSMWEAAMSAGHYRLDNLVVIIDRNRLQIDGLTEEVMSLEPLKEKLSSFGFFVLEIDGHKIEEILEAFYKIKKVKNQPAAIIAKTIKGKGVSFMENQAEWHGVAPNEEQLFVALKELGLSEKIDYQRLKKKSEDYQKKVTKKIEEKVPRYKKDYFWNRQSIMKVKMEPTRFGFGKALEQMGEDERLVCLGLDISGSVKISEFYKNHPERRSRFFSIGIAEQNATTVAAGLAREGKWPVLSTYGVFCSQRNADQMRTTVCYGNLNVLFGGAHGGISVGPDGATHQSLEEISVVGILPNMRLVVPCDSLETEKATRFLIRKIKGPKYIRFAREATPIITDKKTPFVFGKANLYRYLGEEKNFLDAFEVSLSDQYHPKKERFAIIACGPMVAEGLRALWILKEEFRIEGVVVNLHTIKPLDKEVIVKVAQKVSLIITVEEHQKGGFGNLIAAAISEADLGRAPRLVIMGINDTFGESGAPWELLKAFELTGEFIAKKVISSL